MSPGREAVDTWCEYSAVRRAFRNNSRGGFERISTQFANPTQSLYDRRAHRLEEFSFY